MVPEFLKQFLPEYQFLADNLPVDSEGDPYLPLTDQTNQPLVMDVARPGYHLMAHMADESNDRPLEPQLQAIQQEGFLVPSGYATLATSPLEWASGESSALVVFRSPSRLTRERANFLHEDFLEPMIGLTRQEAEGIAPTGFQYWTKRPLPPRQARNAVFRLVPSVHLEGTIRFETGQERSDFFATAVHLVRQYARGELGELDVAEKFCEAVFQHTSNGIDVVGSSGKEELLLSLAAMYTQNKLFEALAACLTRPELVQEVATIKPSYPWTCQVCEHVLIEAKKW